MKTWIKKVNCILIKHDERIEKGLYYHKGGGVFFTEKIPFQINMKHRKSTTFCTNIWHHCCDGHKHVHVL